MLYYLVRPVARFVLSWYYRRIDVTGLEHLPAEGPVILAANHPTAFIEPCILACFQRRPLWFLARGNLFKNALARWVLDQLHILPVFRLRDGGYGRLKDNFATFAACRDALARGRAIMILAEGRCIHERRLRPLRKGTGRIALSTLAAHPELADVPVIPVGVNFTKPEALRSEVFIRLGPPLQTRDFLALYHENENQGVTALTQNLRAALSPLVVQLPPGREAAGETLLRLALSEAASSLAYGLTHDGKSLDGLLRTTQFTPDQDAALVAYGNRLGRHELRDAAVAGNWQSYLQPGGWGWLRVFVGVFLLLWCLPLLALAEYIGGTTTRSIEFYSPVRFAAVAVGLLVYLPLWFIGLKPALIAYALVALLATPWAWGAVEAGQRWFHARMWWRQTPAEREEVLALRQSIIRGTNPGE